MPRPADSILLAPVDAEKLVEDADLVLRRDADAGVADAQADLLVVAEAGDFHGPFSRRIADGVGDQVGKDRVHCFAVAEQAVVALGSRSALNVSFLVAAGLFGPGG